MSFRRKYQAALFVLLPLGAPVSAQRLSPLTSAPDWVRLEAYQETIGRAEFQRLLDSVFAPGGAAAGMIGVRDTDAVIFKTLTPPEPFTLRFANDATSSKIPPRYWRPAAQLGPAPSEKPLAGVR